MLHSGNSSNRKKEVILAGLAALAAIALAAPPLIESQNYLADVSYLASPALKGRYTGSPELETAAAYITNQFKAFGLKPADGKNYEQPFTVTINAHLGTDNHLRVDDGGKKSELVSGRDYVPFSFSSSGKLSAGVVFAGYGITANDLHYDDYAGLDVKDKIVMILRHEP